MRKLPVVILLVLVALSLVTSVTGCRGAQRYDNRLVAADSLMQRFPDSALAIVEAICRDSLAAEGDHAYRALLLTQARYKNYIPATSDSAINRALAYYRAHPKEREKLTRAYIYKGAVMEELGHPDSAMLYYKHAEATAAPDDYFNLGQINTRIADLYRIYYADEEICFDKYKRALHYHRLTGNKRLQQNCLYNMATCRSISNASDTKVYLKQALDLALELNDSLWAFNSMELLCRHLILREGNPQQAMQVAQECLTSYKRFINNEMWMDLAHIQAVKNNNDSARHYLKLVSCSDQQMELRRCWTLSIIAKNEGDTALSNYYNGLKSHISDSIDNDSQKNRIQRIENENNKIQSSTKNQKISTLEWMVKVLIGLSALLMVVLGGFHFRRIRHAKSIIRELKHADLDKHEQLLKQINDKDSVIEHFVQSMVAFMQQSIDASEKDSPAVIRRRIKETVSNLVNDEFWQQLRSFLDKNHHDIISSFAQNPKMTEQDLRFIELLCCGFSYVEMAVTLGYSPNYISTKRKSISKKMGINEPLRDYLDKLLNK